MARPALDRLTGLSGVRTVEVDFSKQGEIARLAEGHDLAVGAVGDDERAESTPAEVGELSGDDLLLPRHLHPHVGVLPLAPAAFARVRTEGEHPLRRWLDQLDDVAARVARSRSAVKTPATNP